MTRKIGILILTILVAGQISFAQPRPPKQLNVKGAFIHSSTQTVFPEKIGSYQRKDVYAFAGRTVDQILKNWKLLETMGYVDTDTIHYGGLRVDWVGDLDGDGNPEILLITSAHSECYSIILYSPDKNMKFKKVSETQLCS